MRRVLGWTALGLVLLLVVGLAAGGWYYSEELLPAPAPGEPAYDVEVLASDEQAGTLELAATDGDLVDLRTVGFRTPAGTVVLDGEVERTERGVVRRGELLFGAWPEAGEQGSPSVATYPGDPETALGLAHETVEVTGPLGPLPAWRVEGDDDGPLAAAGDAGTWVLVVHGRGASLDEGNRSLRTVASLGLPALVVSVRNDPGAAADPDGWGRYGDTEWEDLQAAVTHLREQEQAERFVLIGYSQGAGIVLSFLRRSEDAGAVAGAVGVSPLVSLHETLVLQAQGRGVPDVVIPPLLVVTKAIADLRSGLDFAAVEHADAAEELTTPLLLTHGDADSTVPVAPTRRLAASRSELVTYEEYRGVEHVREWNAEPDRFDEDLRTFLDGLVPTG